MDFCSQRFLFSEISRQIAGNRIREVDCESFYVAAAFLVFWLLSCFCFVLVFRLPSCARILIVNTVFEGYFLDCSKYKPALCTCMCARVHAFLRRRCCSCCCCCRHRRCCCCCRHRRCCCVCTFPSLLLRLYVSFAAAQFKPCRINWIVQSSGVDFLHCLLVSMKWMMDKYDIKGRLSLSIHDEVWFPCHISNLGCTKLCEICSSFGITYKCTIIISLIVSCTFYFKIHVRNLRCDLQSRLCRESPVRHAIAYAVLYEMMFRCFLT